MGRQPGAGQPKNEDLDGVSLFPLVAGSFVAASLLGGVLGGHWADRAGARRPPAAGMVLGVSSALFNAFLGVGSTDVAGHAARRPHPLIRLGQVRQLGG